MDIQVELIRVDKQPETVTVADATFAKLRDLISARNGEFVWVEGPDMTMIVDEEGLIENKPINHVASFKAEQPIVGDALIVKGEYVDAIPYE